MAVFQLIELRTGVAVVAFDDPGGLGRIEALLAEAGHTVVRGITTLAAVTGPNTVRKRGGGTIDLGPLVVTSPTTTGSERGGTLDLGPLAMIALPGASSNVSSAGRGALVTKTAGRAAPAKATAMKAAARRGAVSRSASSAKSTAARKATAKKPAAKKTTA